MAKPTIPKGTRDFLPHETRRRNYIFNTISTVFEKYGYAPIETPAMENLSTLTGKYGEEGDRLIFKILNSGEYLSSVSRELAEFIKGFISEDLIDRYRFWFNEELTDVLRAACDIEVLYGENYPDYKPLNWSVQSLILSNPNFNNSGLCKLTKDQPRLQLLMMQRVGEAFSEYLTRYYAQHENDEPPKDPVSNLHELRKKAGDQNSYVVTRDQIVKSFLGQEIWELKAVTALDVGYLNKHIAEKALRYDLTVPFARYVVNNFNELSFPFKRYQIQPVWRADRPQKGRYREFYQCDADVVGSDSLLNEVEMIQLFDEVLTCLGLDDFTIKINNRKILSGIAEVAGVADQITAVTVALDKLDKIGADGVKKELRDRGIPESAMNTLEPLMAMQGGNDELLAALDKMLAHSETGRKGIAELREVLGHVAELGLNKAKLQVDVTLARGLDYYTGAIFEVLAGGVKMGSICGGGRYDDLTSIFGMDNLSGVGISFGADRIYDVLLELGKFPETVAAGTKLLFINFGENESRFALKQIKALREAGISCELYPDNAKMKKQMKFANDKNVQYVALAGENEIAAGKVNLKNMENGEQQEVEIHNLINHFK